MSRASRLVAAVVVLQVLIPTVALVMPDKPSRLGWQMYSGLGEEPVRVTGARGQPVEIPWSEILPKPRRPEIDWINRLPEYLCTILDEPLITVTVGHRSRTVSC